ncbi:MAG: hypothetical protein CVV50_00770 [Spirochaetae bacterium HGW-Spirochaetae-6]|nr:MAG: hypothetical protein CVV50_00770 [Spirochaetae bacterium HGW-Spirochaetae-6]
MERKHLERLHSLSRQIEAAYTERTKGHMRRKVLETAHGRIWVREAFFKIKTEQNSNNNLKTV